MAITQPGLRAGVVVEPALVTQLVADVTARPGSLPLLQYTLTELFDRRDGSTMTLAAYVSLGGVSGALAKQAEAVYGGLSDDSREAAQRLFLRLVTLCDGAADTRRRARVADLPSIPSDVVDAFGDRRLVTFDRDPATRQQTIEIAHEALISAWPRLEAWLDDDREALRTLRSIGEAAVTWSAAGMDRDELCRGADWKQRSNWPPAVRTCSLPTNGRMWRPVGPNMKRCWPDNEARRVVSGYYWQSQPQGSSYRSSPAASPWCSDRTHRPNGREPT